MKRGNSNLVIFILIFLIILIFVAFVIFLFVISKPKPPEPVNTIPPAQIVNQGNVYVKVYDAVSGSPITTEYRVKRSDGFFWSGLIAAGQVEQIQNLTSNYTYEAVFYSPNYYGKVIPLGWDIGNAEVRMQPLPSISLRNSNLDSMILVQVTPSSFLQGTAICEWHSINVIRVSALDVTDNKLGVLAIPDRLKYHVDNCFSIGDINISYNVLVNYSAPLGLTSSDYIDFVVLDQNNMINQSAFDIGFSDGTNDIGVPDQWINVSLSP